MIRLLRLTTILTLLFICTSTKAVNNDSLSLAKKGVAILSVQTLNGELPTCDYVWAPEGANGISITNYNKVPGRVVLIEGDSILFDSGDYEKYVSGMTIRIRGNTSAYYYSKKPYKIKLEKKNDMLARGDKAYYDKNWVLLRDGDSNLKTMMGFKLNELLGLGGWTPAYKFVNLFLNGKYQGVYMLVESVKRNSDCRLDVDKATGYIIERDSYWWNEDVFFKSSLGKEYTFKYPDSEDLDVTQLEYIQQAIEQMEQAIADGSYDQLIDTRSFAAWLLAHDILGTYDSGGANIYLTKYDNTDTTKIAMSTLWDFDSTFRNTGKWARIHESTFFYFPLLLNSENRSFVTEYCRLWNEQSATVLSEMKRFLQQYLSTDECMRLNFSRQYDARRWIYNPVYVGTNINDGIKWFDERKAWLDMQIKTIVADNISNTSTTDRNDKNNAVYSLQGVYIGNKARRPGIYIIDGRKQLVK